jgi:hypothetical protein
MPTLTPPLDPSLAYVFCPICRSQGNSQSPLTRDGTGSIRCQFQHGPFTLEQLQSSDMVKSSELFIEQPTITDIRWPIFVNPDVKAKLERKFSGRLMITLATYLAAIADDSIVMITGEQAGKLRALGITNGQQILSTVEMAKQTERELDESNKTIQKFMGLIAAAQAPEA